MSVSLSFLVWLCFCKNVSFLAFFTGLLPLVCFLVCHPPHVVLHSFRQKFSRTGIYWREWHMAVCSLSRSLESIQLMLLLFGTGLEDATVVCCFPCFIHFYTWYGQKGYACSHSLTHILPYISNGIGVSCCCSLKMVSMRVCSYQCCGCFAFGPSVRVWQSTRVSKAFLRSDLQCLYMVHLVMLWKRFKIGFGYGHGPWSLFIPRWM